MTGMEQGKLACASDSTIYEFPTPAERNRFGILDRMEVLRWGGHRWSTQGPRGCTICNDAEAEFGNYALIYPAGREWAAWGVARDGAAFVRLAHRCCGLFWGHYPHYPRGVGRHPDATVQTALAAAARVAGFVTFSCHRVRAPHPDDEAEDQDQRGGRVSSAATRSIWRVRSPVRAAASRHSRCASASANSQSDGHPGAPPTDRPGPTSSPRSPATRRLVSWRRSPSARRHRRMAARPNSSSAPRRLALLSRRR